MGWWLGSGRGKGVQKPDELVILRNQNQTLLSTRISAAVFISVIVYPATLQFVTISSSYLKSLSVKYHFKPLLHDTRLTRLTSFNAPGISEMKRSTFHCSTSCIFFKNGDKPKQIQRCK